MEPEVTQTNYLYTWRTVECFHSIGPHADGKIENIENDSSQEVTLIVSYVLLKTWYTYK